MPGRIAFNEDEMGGFGFRPAPQINPAELGRLGTAPGRRRPASAQLSDVGSSRSSNYAHDGESDVTGADAESPQVVDLDAFQAWRRRESLQEAAEGPPRRWTLTPTARALVGVIAIIGSVFALKGAVSVPARSPIMVRSTRSFQAARPLLGRATPARCQGRTARSRRRTRSARNNLSISKPSYAAARIARMLSA